MRLIIEGLKKSFDKKTVLKNIDFTFEQGKIYGLLGKNGAGKTTLFNCLNEDTPVDGGSFTVEDTAGRRSLRPEDIGYVLSSPTVPDFLTGREFIKFFIDINGGKMREILPVDSYFDLMDIAFEDRDKLMKDYSHGMKNKMQMLVNIMANPKILLLDEPLTSFDVLVAEEMKGLLINIKPEHIIIFSTHIMELALGLCDEIVILNEGELELIEKADLNSQGLKDKVIRILRGDEDA